jgi:lysyl endopeptidase
MRSAGFVIALIATSVLAQPSETGDSIPLSELRATPAGIAPNARHLIQIEDEDASYIKVHFHRFAIAPGDRVVIASADRRFSWTYDSTRSGSWWSPAVPGTTAVIELFTGPVAQRNGFAIDRFIRGYDRQVVIRAPANNPGGVLRICGTDDRHHAICFEPDAAMSATARATARLMVGSRACTAWLWGSAGHVLTNHHCVSNSAEAEAATMTFDAQATTCGGSCPDWASCPGTTLTASMTLVKSSRDLDYSLLLLSANPVGTYGYLRARSTGPDLKDTVYIPQHPFGYEKRIAAHSSHPADEGPPRLTPNAIPSCTAPKADIGYYADTSSGSSGSPVIADADHLVIALHHCLGCTPSDQEHPNTAVPIDAIISDLGSSLPPDAVGPP